MKPNASRIAGLLNACALVTASLALAACGSPAVVSSTGPACATWSEIPIPKEAESILFGPNYPAEIGPNFPAVRPLLVDVEANNRKRRDFCKR